MASLGLELLCADREFGQLPAKALGFLWLDAVETWDSWLLGEASEGMEGLKGHCLKQADNTDHQVVWEGKIQSNPEHPEKR